MKLIIEDEKGGRVELNEEDTQKLLQTLVKALDRKREPRPISSYDVVAWRRQPQVGKVVP